MNIFELPETVWEFAKAIRTQSVTDVFWLKMCEGIDVKSGVFEKLKLDAQVDVFVQFLDEEIASSENMFALGVKGWLYNIFISGHCLKAAENGNAFAQFQMANYYYRTKDYCKAQIWCSKAAKQDFVPAQLKLGFMYELGGMWCGKRSVKSPKMVQSSGS